MNYPLTLAFSSRRQEYTYCQNCSTGPLADLHGAHQGVYRMQAQAKEFVYWPGIDADIADYVSQCTICTKHKASPPAQHMLPKDIRDGPWQDIVADYITHESHEYLIICNAFSKYPCNGLPFTSDELTEFLMHHHIKHHTSSPHFPRSNGFIERQVLGSSKQHSILPYQQRSPLKQFC